MPSVVCYDCAARGGRYVAGRTTKNLGREDARISLGQSHIAHNAKLFNGLLLAVLSLCAYVDVHPAIHPSLLILICTLCAFSHFHLRSGRAGPARSHCVETASKSKTPRGGGEGIPEGEGREYPTGKLLKPAPSPSLLLLAHRGRGPNYPYSSTRLHSHSALCAPLPLH